MHISISASTVPDGLKALFKQYGLRVKRLRLKRTVYQAGQQTKHIPKDKALKLLGAIEKLGYRVDSLHYELANKGLLDVVSVNG
jgi:hypothetical protein